MLHFSIFELDASASAVALPLVRLAQPELEFERWRQNVEALRLRNGGVLGLEVESGALMGVATYEVVEKPRFGRVLQVSFIVTAEVSRKAPLRRLLMGGLREVAARLGCSETLVAVAKRPPPHGRRKSASANAKRKSAGSSPGLD